ncbi:2-oxoglutarate dehydrogenase complex protein, putative [Theileria equi strain WA]|uniref:Dihydrolipoamide acetyltransferase component of pyruvate dehydrogenase complex n=1 Tax=Theileria equi strain WA TaxID=1537102 RepID=L0B2X0_THEEQ|nr:2-oxoglutarate dehydrogenase complex protein, putative [Theileria equi strain WA]AFZ81444.1 2-oxoglutarate dehydrogenase complex protein, putative [Theileria equi strain WA]|eukprot:XP_004831110.1 2-oxoglutarate dehydrogenase complex protein, putative [Theileria equi strain WA]
MAFTNLYRLVRPTFRHAWLARSFHISTRRNALTTFNLSDIGEGISEVELIKWEKKVGDEVEEMEAVCTVQSDKAAVEITSRYTGIVKHLYVAEGDIIKIGKPLMDIETEDQVQLEVKEEPVKNKFEPNTPKVEEKSFHKPQATGVVAPPAVKKRAKELGVDLALVTPTGSQGQVTMKDLEDFASQDASATKVKLDGIGSAMVKSMVASLEVPHVTVGDDLDMTNLLDVYRKRRASDQTVRITATPYLIKAVSLALSKVPIMNTKFSGDGYLQFKEHNISVAIASPHGLLVPNVKNVQDLSIRDIQKELTRLQAAANEKKLTGDDIKGGTCTLSNLGAIGGTFVAARLFDGQACIIALGASKLRPEYVKDGSDLKIEPRSIAPVGITADHRHIDGATIAKFAAELKSIIANAHELDKHF